MKNKVSKFYMQNKFGVTIKIFKLLLVVILYLSSLLCLAARMQCAQNLSYTEPHWHTDIHSLWLLWQDKTFHKVQQYNQYFQGTRNKLGLIL